MPHSLDITNILLLIIAAASLLILKSEFQLKSEPFKLGGSVLISAILLSVALLYGSIGFSRLPYRDFERHYSLKDGFIETIKEFTLTNEPHDIKTTKVTEAFLLSLRGLGIASLSLAGYALLQPLIYQFEHNEEAQQHARALLERYGGDSEDYFKLWPYDKEYIFSDDGQAAIAYKVRSGVALSAGDPFGNRASYENVTQKFDSFCNNHGLTMSFVQVTKKEERLYKSHNLLLQKIGEEAVVNLEDFCEKTSKNKKWRHVINKFEKLGYEFELRTPPHSQTFLSELQRISDEWLETPGRIERGYIMGYFNREYLANCPIAILRNEEKQIAGFLNLVQSFDPHEANMDLFRQRSGSPTNMIDFLLAKVLESCRANGFQKFNLGLCPLVGLDEDEENGPASKALSLVYTFGGKLYSFKGLYQFKSKFEPLWRDRYLAMPAGAFTIAKVAGALQLAMRVENENKHQ